ncbi:MAG: FAD-binding protein [Crocinitomicaceae bacterium]|nr:FAD-dependent oxidoreductase [Flavobacteriales bacterium]NQZ36034.1 FAD-binding protein [Crocinitomicaceae bacterium]
MKNSLTPEFRKSAPKNLKIIERSDSLYHYARVVSNTRFGSQPSAIVYCRNAKDVKYCIDYCRNEKFDFRVRSGGHQHEGMCSANDVMIIDLSEINKIEEVPEKSDQAWIPSGMQLETVYSELGITNQTIPGGGCQSVNVGGLTQGGGWGYSIRKFGFTCDNVLEVEMILPDGNIELISETNHPDIFWALKGGGGGNFGVVTRFRFQLSELTPKVTNFALSWTKRADIEYVISTFMNLHTKTGDEELNPALSSSCTMILADPNKEKEKRKLGRGEHSLVDGRMGGQFYGSKEKLVKLLRESYPELNITKKSFSILKQVPKEPQKGDDVKAKAGSLPAPKSSLHRHQAVIADFLNPTSSYQLSEYVETVCADRDFRILPTAPASTCDRPHPHKISSSFPKKFSETDNEKMTKDIYDFMAKSCYYSDVNKYMSFHCLGGAIRKNPENRVFAFSDKPYMLQIQCWWDDISNAFTNETRNTEYVNWVEEFKTYLSHATEGSFINFVDYHLVDNPNTPEGKLELLEIYYGKEKLNMLRKIKTKHDQKELFKFKMSIPPFDK